MQEIIIYVFLLVVFELYESSWQKGDSFGDILANIYKQYKRGIFYFFLSHPSFIYTLFLGIKFELANFWFMSLLFFKFLDIAYKLALIKKIEKGEIEELFPLPLNTPVHKFMSYLNVIIYPPLLYLAFMQG